MRKIDELKDPDSCLNRALPDDIIFVLKDKDEAMAATVRFWARERVRLGLNKEGDLKILEAMEIADLVEAKQQRK